jgi:hypothetical protein
MAVVEPVRCVEVVLEATVQPRLQHQVVANIQDTTVAVADLGCVCAEGYGTERDG